MIETVNAVFENGAFKPLNDVHLSEGMKVKLIIEPDNEQSINEILSLVTEVYDGLFEKEISEIEKIAFDRKDFFRRSDNK